MCRNVPCGQDGVVAPSAGMSEDGFLNPLRELVNRGYTRAEEMLKNYYGFWGRDLTPLFTEYNFL